MVSPAQLSVLAAWIAVGLVLTGGGALIARAWRAPLRAADDLLLCFWLGWAALVLALQAWHLARPIDDAARLLAAAAGTAGLALAGAAPWRAMARAVPRHVPLLAAGAVLAVWLSNHALGGARYGDVNGYFVPTVRWLLAHPIVPGLANLHAHYALNQSYFGYLAALEAGTFAGRSYHLANGLLVLALGLRVLLAGARLARLGRAVAPVDVYYTLLAPGVFAFGVSIWLTSPNPDVGVFALGAVAGGELLALATEAPARRRLHLRALTVLAAAGVTVKLSFTGFAAAAVPVALALWLARERPAPRAAVREAAVLGAIGLAAIGPWVARNVVMSGLPFYPSALVALPVEWRVGTDVEGWLRNTVFVGGWRAILASPGWFAGILRNWGWFEPDVAGPAALGTASFALAAARRIGRGARGRGTGTTLPLLLFLPGAASLAFCIVLSPVPRYAGATVWIIGAMGVLLAAADAICRPRSAVRAALLLLVVAASAATLRAGLDPLWLPLTGFEPVAAIRWEPRHLESGTVVNVPIGIEACGSVPLPCTPYPNPALRARRPDDPGAGFILDPALAARHRYDPGQRGGP
jgi:hypothetical protein